MLEVVTCGLSATLLNKRKYNTITSLEPLPGVVVCQWSLGSLDTRSVKIMFHSDGRFLLKHAAD